MWLSYNSADYLYKSIYPRHGAEAPVRNGASGSYLARATSRKTRILVGITWQAIGWLSNRKLGSVNGASLDMRFTTLGPFGTAGGESAEAVRAFSPASAGSAAGRAFPFSRGRERTLRAAMVWRHGLRERSLAVLGSPPLQLLAPDDSAPT